jgi:ABC-2 type transport system permease protein
MIRTIISISLLRLWHNRSELLLVFVVPVIFFSIFALIFAGRSDGSTPRITVVFADTVDDVITRRAIDLLIEQGSVRLYSAAPKRSSGAAPDEGPPPVERVTNQQAQDLVRRGIVNAAVVFLPSEDIAAAGDPALPPERSPHRLAGTAMPRVELLSDAYDQVASQVVVALLQQALAKAGAEQAAAHTHSAAVAMRQSASLSTAQPAAGDVLEGYQLRRLSDQLTGPGAASGSTSAVIPAAASGAANDSAQRAVFESLTGSAADALAEANSSPSVAAAPQLASVTLVDVLGEGKTNPAIAMYAAGIAVMFLLFSTTTAGGSLLEERENATLERLLSSQLTMDQLLMGKWLYLVLLGATQASVMFVWGWLVFGVDLLGHLDGFLVITLATAGAASSFALLLASVCRSRNQLNWVSIVAILSMSALGGSMVPRYLMSPAVQQLGLGTFNAWALEGYNKVFWRELPVRELWPELAVLTGCGFVFLVLARLLAVRWETS